MVIGTLCCFLDDGFCFLSFALCFVGAIFGTKVTTTCMFLMVCDGSLGFWAFATGESPPVLWLVR